MLFTRNQGEAIETHNDISRAVVYPVKEEKNARFLAKSQNGHGVLLGCIIEPHSQLFNHKELSMKLSMITGIALFSTTLFTASVQADSPCKELSESACKNNAQCTYVSSYTTSKGTQVSAYCRKKPGTKTTTTTEQKAAQPEVKKTQEKTQTTTKVKEPTTPPSSNTKKPATVSTQPTSATAN